MPASAIGVTAIEKIIAMINSKGIASIVPAQGKEVQGVVWRVTPLDEREIDINEGYDENPDKSRCDKLPLPVRMSSGMRLVPSRHGVHLPQDSDCVNVRKNFAMSTMV